MPFFGSGKLFDTVRVEKRALLNENPKSFQKLNLSKTTEVIMKKLIRISAFLSLMFVFSVVFASAQRQTVKQYSVNVPFEFNVGQKSYPAGDYQIKLVKISSDAVSLSVMDGENKNLQTVIAPRRGDAATDEPKLIFSRYKNRRFLSQVKTKETGFALIKTAAEKRAAERNTEFVSVR